MSGVRSVLFHACLLSAVLVAGCARGDGGKHGKPAHVVLISLDTLRADRLGAYGYHRDTAPNLSALARESVMFRVAGAQATQTLISHKSIFTGKYPLRLIREVTNADLPALVALEKPREFLVATFARLKSRSLIAGLRDAGYQTAAFTDGGWMSREMGFAEGFDLFDDQGGHLAGILPRVDDWLQNNTDAPSFLFVHTFDIHCPYPTREPYDSLFCRRHSDHIDLDGLCGKPHLMSMTLSPADLEGISNHYDGGIVSADAYVGDLLSMLRRVKIYDEALIIVTSDHGESLGEHEQVGHGGLYLEQILVPLVIKFPASWKIPAAVINEPVEMVDVVPTILEASGLPLPADLDGRSLMPVITKTGKGRRYLVAQTTYREGREGTTNPAKRAILDPGGWLLIHDERNRTAEMFDLSDDPLGFDDVAGQHPPALVALLGALTARDLGRAVGDLSRPEEPKISDELEEQLRALGYVGN